MWMTEDDERILEVLREEGRSSVDTIASDDQLQRDEVVDRLDVLSETPLVDQFGFQSYEITYPGQQFLDGSFDAYTLPNPEN